MRKGEGGWKGEVWGGQNMWAPREGTFVFTLRGMGATEEY